MARTVIYERGVHSIVADNALYEKLNSLENGLKIKEEPLDSDSEHSNNDTSLPEADTATYGQKAESNVTSSSSLNNKENECVSKARSRKKNRKHDGYRKRKKARRPVPKIVCKSKCANDSEGSKNEERQGKGVAQEVHRSFKTRKEEGNSDRRNQTSQHYQLAKRNPRTKWKAKSQPEEEILLQCDVCFLPMKDFSQLKRHQQLRSADIMYPCKKCETLFADKRSFIFHSETCSGIRHPYAVSCDFCEKFFRTKHILQAHIFHMHSDQIFQSNPVKVSPDTRKHRNLATPKVGGPRTSRGTSRSCLPNITSNGPNCQTNQQVLNFCKNDTTEALNAHDLLSTPVKKMRQTTLTEFLKVSSKKIENFTLPKDEATEGRSMESRENKRMCSDKCSKPFVQIHTNTTLMMELLNNSGHVKDEPSDDEIQNITSRHNTPYKLRPTRPTVYTPDTFYYLESSMKRKRIYSETEKMLGKNEGRSPKKARQDNRRNDSKIKASFGIKECYIQLVRYDSVGKTSGLVSLEGRKPSTSQRIDTLQNPIALQNLQEPIFKLNGSSIETDREVKAEHHPEERSLESHGKPYQCKICKKMFSSKKNLSEHKELFHVAYVSSVCNARYTSKYKLLHHYLRQHTIFKRTVCCVCKESFANRSLLQRHLLIHCVRVLRTKHDRFPVDVIIKCNAFQKNHQCDNCGKRFWLSSCMKYHENICFSRTRDRSQKASPAQNVPSITPSSREACHINNRLPKDNISSAMHSVTKPVAKEATITNQSPSSSESAKSRTLEKSVNRVSMTSAGPTHEKPWLRKREKIDYGTKDNSSDSEAESSFCRPENTIGPVGTDPTPASLECSICNIKFNSIAKLNYHTRTYGGELNHRCGLCSLALPNKRLLDQHIHMAHTQYSLGKNRNNCKFCNQAFNNADLQQMHEKHLHASRITVVPEQTWLNEEQVWNINTACNTCNVVFETYDRFVEHNMYYYKGQSFTCTFCGQTFHGLFMLHHHSKLAHYPEATRKSYSYICDACNEGFNQESHFHAHKLHVHLNESNKSLNALPDTQEQASVSSIQVTTVPTIETRQLAFAIYGCNICQMFFTSEADLTAHETEYSVNGDYLCNGCDKRCRTLLILKQHYSLNHIGPDVPSAYKCKQCLEVFTVASSLACHEKHLHPEESSHRYDLIAALEKNVDRAIGTGKPERLDPASTGKPGSAILKCLICGMAFEKEIDLREHLFEYSNIGEYSCAVCHRKFAETARLEEHKMKHSRINTILAEHHCPICQEGFTSAPNVKTHMLHLHGYETFQSVLAKRGCLSTKLLPDHPSCNIDSDSVSHTIPALQTDSGNQVDVELRAPSKKQANTVIAKTFDILQESNSNVLGEENSKRHSVEENPPTLMTANTSNAKSANDCFIVDTAVQTSFDNPIPNSVKKFKSSVQDVQPRLQTKIIVVDPQNQSLVKLLKNLATPTDSESLENVQYQCAECCIKFNSRRNIAKHIIKYMNRGDFLCDVCPRRFPCESIYQEHYRKHQGSEEITFTEYRYTCQLCSERFRTQRAYRSHLNHLHKKKDPLNSQKDTQLFASNSTGQPDQQQPNSNNSLYSQASSQAEPQTPKELLDKTHIGEPSNQYKKAETDAMITSLAKSVSPTSQSTSSACLDYYSCQACSMSFDNFSAYHSHCKSVHPHLLLLVDYISSGPNPVSKSDTLSSDFKCTTCNIPFNDARSFNKHTKDIHVKDPSASNSCIIPIENGSEELRIIWEKKPRSSNSLESVGRKNDTVAVNSTDTEKRDAAENTTIPRLKVKPFAKIIETLTIENQVEPAANVYF